MQQVPVLVVETPSSPHGHRYLVAPGREIGDEDAARLCSRLGREGHSDGADWLGCARLGSQVAFGGGREAFARVVLAGIDVGRLSPDQKAAVDRLLGALLDDLDGLIQEVDWSNASRTLVVPSPALAARLDPTWDELPRPAVAGTARSPGLRRRAAMFAALAAVIGVIALTIRPGGTDAPPEPGGPQAAPGVAPGQAAAPPDLGIKVSTPVTPAPGPGLPGALALIDKLPVPWTGTALGPVFDCFKDATGRDGDLTDPATRAALFKALADRLAGVARGRFGANPPQAGEQPVSLAIRDARAFFEKDIKESMAAWNQIIQRAELPFDSLRTFFDEPTCRDAFWKPAWLAAEGRVFEALKAELGLSDGRTCQILISDDPVAWNGWVAACESFLAFGGTKTKLLGGRLRNVSGPIPREDGVRALAEAMKPLAETARRLKEGEPVPAPGKDEGISARVASPWFRLLLSKSTDDIEPRQEAGRPHPYSPDSFRSGSLRSATLIFDGSEHEHSIMAGENKFGKLQDPIMIATKPILIVGPSGTPFTIRFDFEVRLGLRRPIVEDVPLGTKATEFDKDYSVRFEYKPSLAPGASSLGWVKPHGLPPTKDLSDGTGWHLFLIPFIPAVAMPE